MFDLASLSQALVRQAQHARPDADAPPPPPSPPCIDGATPGCYALALSDGQYHRHTTSVSSTMLKQMLRSPRHYRAWREGGDTDTPARRFGRAVHCHVLERHRFEDRYVVWPMPDRRGSAYQAFVRANAHKTVLSREEHARVSACADALLSDRSFALQGFLRGLKNADGGWDIAPARTEFSIFWTDEATGLTCKVRLDAWIDDPLIVLDLKTCGDARQHAFTRDIVNLHYDLQAAFYMEGVRHFTGQSNGVWVFGAVEGEGGHGTAFYALGAGCDLLLNGKRKYRHALDLMARCDQHKRWPSYDFEQVIEPLMPSWMVFDGA